MRLGLGIQVGSREMKMGGLGPKAISADRGALGFTFLDCILVLPTFSFTFKLSRGYCQVNIRDLQR